MAISFPLTPATNDVYTYNNKSWTYNGTTWIQQAGAIGATIQVANTVPASAVVGSLWWDSDTGDFSVFFANTWAGLTATGPADGSITTGKLADGAVTAAKLATGAAVPSQTGQSGKYLTTDGTNASWTTVTTTPADGSITAAKLGLGTTYLPMAVGNTAQRPGSPAVGFMRINSDTNYLEAYYNSSWINLQFLGLITATSSGATVTTVGNYKLLTYTTSGTFTVTDAPVGSTVEVLLIGGGGAGGTGYGGGGGAGGYYYSSTMAISASSYTVTIGAGATSTSVTLGVGASGSSTSFNSQTALGGGGGGEYNTNTSVKGTNGGSGGGAGGVGTTSASIGTGTSTQGNNGGTAAGTGASSAFGGGGGGAGAVGSNASGTVAGAGGVGLVNPITGSTVGQNVSSTYYVAGGGGGGGYTGGTAGSGGNGGGGAGTLSATNGLLPQQLTFATGWTYQNASQTNTNSVAPDGSTTATLMTMSASLFDLYYNKTGLTSSLTYTFTVWVKLGTATNFAVAFNNTSAWNTISAPGIKTYTSADGLNASTWTKISHDVTGVTAMNMHLGGHGNSGQAQQTAGTLYLWAPSLTVSGVPTQATSGTSNTGGGGGGSGDWTSSYGGSGGSGVAVIKYRFQ
jgi:hypothetical protein